MREFMDPESPAIAVSDESQWLNLAARRTPWWAISLAAHLLLFAIVMAWKVAVTIIPADADFGVTLLPPRKVDDLVVERPHLPPSNAQVSDPDPVDDEEVVSELEDPNPAETDDDNPLRQSHGDESCISTVDGHDAGFFSVTGVGGGAGGTHGTRSGGMIDRIGRRRSTPGLADGAVMAGLEWLARHQHDDGSWSSRYNAECKRTICDQRRDADAVALTGISLLAFLGAGYTPNSSDVFTDKHTGEVVHIGEVVRAGLRWLKSRQQSDGSFDTPGSSKSMYSQAIAALTFAEAYGMTGSVLLKEPAQRAVDFVIAARNPYRAWRYSPRCGDNDTSVSGWAVMALKSAEVSGLSVSRSAMEEVLAFYEEVTDPNYGRCGYQSREDAGVKVCEVGMNDDYANHAAMTAVGMMVRAFVRHDIKDPMLELGARVLTQDMPVFDRAKKINDYYYWYYGTLALFQYDGPDSGNRGTLWKKWNAAMLDAVARTQEPVAAGCLHGSWSADDRWGHNGGRVYATALNTMTLEVYYRYESAFGIGKRR